MAIKIIYRAPRKRGRKPKLSADQRAHIIAEYENGVAPRFLIAKYGVSRSTIARAVEKHAFGAAVLEQKSTHAA